MQPFQCTETYKYYDNCRFNNPGVFSDANTRDRSFDTVDYWHSVLCIQPAIVLDFCFSISVPFCKIMDIVNLFGFSKPVDRPTPSISANEIRTVKLSYYDIAKILKIAEHAAYSLAHLNQGDITFRSPSVGELSRKEIADCMQDFVGHKKVPTTHFAQDVEFSFRTLTIDNIHKLLFDFEVWLSAECERRRLDNAGLVFYHIKNDFEHCRLIRCKLKMQQ